MNERIVSPEKTRPPQLLRQLPRLAVSQTITPPENSGPERVVFDIKSLPELAQEASRKKRKTEFDVVLARVGSEEDPHPLFAIAAQLGLLRMTPEIVEAMGKKSQEELARYVSLFDDRLTQLAQSPNRDIPPALAQIIADLRALQKEMRSNPAYQELLEVAEQTGKAPAHTEEELVGTQATKVLSAMIDTNILSVTTGKNGQPIFKIRPYEKTVAKALGMLK